MADEFRSPSLQVAVAGLEIVGAIAADIHSNNHFATDRFRLQFASQVTPLAALQIPGQRFDVSMGISGVWRSLITGIADSVSYDPTSGVVDVEGRDLAALLIEAQTDETFANRTSSEIAGILAARHGLGALADPTTTAVGRYYQSEHDRVTLGQFAKTTTEWDLLAYLASREGFDLFMSGPVLRFGAPMADVTQVITPGDCSKLQLEHCIALARPMDVTVKSWSSKSATTVVVESRAPGVGTPWTRLLTRPNLTADEAGRLAARTISDTKRHEWGAHVQMPGDLLLTPRSQVVLAGTGTEWDRAYTVSEISRHLDVKRGFTQRLVLQGVV